MSIADELSQRLRRPQRHRLLQGHPTLPLMRSDLPAPRGSWQERAIDGAVWERRLHPNGESQVVQPWVEVEAQRSLIVGVIPHTMCTPSKPGCGFCTFPHDRFDKRSIAAFVEETLEQTEVMFRRTPKLEGRKLAALYFGGGTANLTPTRELQLLFDAVARHLEVSGAEITLEGVPALFLDKRLFGANRIEWLAALPVRHKRVSMGVQTFEPTQLARMGREAFGDRQTVEQVVRAAHRHGMTASGDFLFNLPGQSRAAMLDDVAQAIATGLDQICVYHLVAYPGLGTAWSKDEALLATLPSVDEAAANFLAVREALLSAGFVQTTLTNFERKEVNATDRRFLYEELSFAPEHTDAVGLGPLAISTLVDLPRRRAMKVVREKTSLSHRGGGALWFPYEEEDLRLLFLVRALPRLRISRTLFERAFGADFADALAEPIDALGREGLVTLDAEALQLTPRGMFFADAVVGLLAARRAEQLKGSAAGRTTMQVLDDATPSFMG